ncbi:MAG TPA: hypothetical protein VLL52_08745 [Anaerolineae bacterium]|nr:hypothetical protein [Anaerolineae bacterium]
MRQEEQKESKNKFLSPLYLYTYLALGLLVVGSGILWWILRQDGFIYGFSVLFVVVHVIAVGVDLVQGKIKSVKMFVVVSCLHVLDTLRQLVSIGMFVPMILFELIMGPLAFLVLVVAAAGVGIYGIEEIIGYDIQGYSWYGTDQEALWLLIALPVSLLVLYLRLRFEDWGGQDRMIDLIVHGLGPFTLLMDWLQKQID